MRQASRCNFVLLSSQHRSTSSSAVASSTSDNNVRPKTITSPSRTSSILGTSRIPLGAALGLSKRYSNILGMTRVSSGTGMTSSSSSASVGGIGGGSSVVDSGFVVTEEVPSKLLTDWRPWVGEHRKPTVPQTAASTTTPSASTAPQDGETPASSSSSPSSSSSTRTVHQGRRAPGSTDLAVSVSQVSAARFMGTVEAVSVGFTDAIIARERLLLNNTSTQPSTTTAASTPSKGRGISPTGSSASKRSGLTSTSSTTAGSSSSVATKASIGGPFTSPVVSITLSIPSERVGGADQKIAVLCPISPTLCARFMTTVDGASTTATKSSGTTTSIRLEESPVLEYLRSSTGLEVNSRVIVAGSLRSVLRRTQVSDSSSSHHHHTFPSSFVELPQDGVWNGAVTVV